MATVSSESVLIIDDEPVVRESLAMDLKRGGYDLFFAQNGAEGIEMVSDVTPAVIILDLRMPVMNGMEFLEQIDLKPSDPYTVIVLTGHGDEFDLRACYDAGVRNFLKKPFNLFEVRGVVKNALELQQFTNHLDDVVKERTAKLDQRLKEITALNKLFQDHISKRSGVAGAYREVMIEFQTLADGMTKLSKRLSSLPTPDPMDFRLDD